MSERGRSQKQLRIFLSYVPKDLGLAREVAAQLREDAFDVFLDVDAVEPGDNVALTTGRALERADAAVVLLSDDSMDSERARDEWDYLLGTRRFARRVLPVVTPGTTETRLPWIWKKLQHVKAGSDRKQLPRRVARALKDLLERE